MLFRPFERLSRSSRRLGWLRSLFQRHESTNRPRFRRERVLEVAEITMVFRDEPVITSMMPRVVKMNLLELRTQITTRFFRRSILDRSS